ncbi:hypothetical protein [Bradyrhizobium sp. AZCC 2230]|uniref:hypothetical protein n=1 Tax=Bradyrhizobium sp. AZCC 2230 TaxID=3117021 RepID=UPI002FEF8706
MALTGGLIIDVAAIMPHTRERSKQKRDAHLATVLCFPQSGMVGRREMFPRRHCERSEAIQNLSAEEVSQ